MEVRPVHPDDEDSLAECAAVLVASDKDMWPDMAGYDLPDLRGFARFSGTSRRWEILAAAEPGGPVLGMGLMEFPLLENRHSTEITVAVHPEHRRRGVGTAIVRAMADRVVSAGRRTLNSIVDVPLAHAGEHASGPFARKLGFVPTLGGNLRLLRLPLDQGRLAGLRRTVAAARDASTYRTLTWENPWPREFVDDLCTLMRVMSTDEPAGDGERQAETWDEQRLRENEELDAAREVRSLAAVAQHIPSGRLVGMTELLIADRTPAQSWQMITVVHPDHRGHRLGLAIKLANLELLAETAPGVSKVVTGNASVNAPMVAVNDMLGFEIFSEGAFWQKQLAE